MYTSTGPGPLGRSLMEDSLDALAYHRTVWPGISKELATLSKSLGGKVPSLKEISQMELGYRDLGRVQLVPVPAPDSWLVTTLRKWLRIPESRKFGTVNVVQGEGGAVHSHRMAEEHDSVLIKLPAPFVPVAPTEQERRWARVLDAAELLVVVREKLTTDAEMLAMLDDYLSAAVYGRLRVVLNKERDAIVLRLKQAEVVKAKTALDEEKARQKYAKEAAF